MGKRKFWMYSRRLGPLVAAGFVCQQIGCLPDQAFQQVTAENLVLTFAVIVQSVTSLVFNTIFGVV